MRSVWRGCAPTLDRCSGHGTFLDASIDTDAQVLASVAGTVVRVNKLISVHPLRSRYRPEVGDLVLARVTEVGSRRWKCDARGRLDAVLMLSSIHLPGGVQRRKLESDELQMREFFTEGDLLVAEVQNFFGDGSMSLHTRSLKYGKLRNGLLVTVPPALVVRLKSHFRSLPCGVDLILGLNGMIWVAASSSKSGASGAGDSSGGHTAAPIDAEHVASAALYSSVNDPISADQRETIARVAACIRALAEAGAPVSDASIAAAYDASLPDDMAVDGAESGYGVLELEPGSIGARAIAAAAVRALDA